MYYTMASGVGEEASGTAAHTWDEMGNDITDCRDQIVQTDNRRPQQQINFEMMLLCNE